MLIRRTELEGQRADVRLRGPRIEAIAPSLEPLGGEIVVEARGGALLPGLHDHHIHLLALAASLASVRCGPPEVPDASALAAVLGAATPGRGGWIRGYGYHEHVAGDLDAAALEALVPGASPIRMQHRSGALWIVNAAGLERLGLGSATGVEAPDGVERDASGRPTGRLYRVDAWLRQRLDEPAPPELAPVGTLLGRCGVTGATDATPGNAADELALLTTAHESGALPQELRVMGTLALPVPSEPGLTRGAVKRVLDESGILDPEGLAESIREARAEGRATAVHCVTRAELVVALAAFDAAGADPGDRIEHASVAPPELARRLAELGLTVVTQPNFVRERGDAYLRDVDERDQPWLYRCQGLVDAGVGLGGGTDAPFGDPDPWRAMQAAVDRRSAAGVALGRGESLSPERALALFTTPAGDPGGAPRRIAPGEAADLCLLRRPWTTARDALDCEDVAATIAGGRICFVADSLGKVAGSLGEVADATPQQEPPGGQDPVDV